MKTTIDLADELFKRAKTLAAERGTTLRALIEQGLREELARQSKPRKFRLSDKSIDGKGLQPEFAGKSWADIRDAAYGTKGF